MFFVMIFVGCAIGLVAGLMSPEREKPKKPYKPKKRLFSGAGMNYGNLQLE